MVRKGFFAVIAPLRLPLLTLACLALAAASLWPAHHASAAQHEPLVFGVISTASEDTLRRAWTPLFTDMSAALGRPVAPYFAPDYAGIIKAMRAGKVQVAWFGNKSALEAVDHAGGEIFAQGVNPDGSLGYHSLLLAHRDSPLNSLDDVLKSSHRLSFGNGDPNSTSGSLVPGYYIFAKKKTAPERLFRSVRGANHETNALDVANRRVDVATCNDRSLARLAESHPAKHALVKVVWTSPLIPSSPLVWRADLGEALKGRIRDFIMGYGARSGPDTAKSQAQRQVLAVLGYSGFRPADNALLLTIRQLELFKQRSDLGADASLSRAERGRRLAEIDRRLDELQRQSQHQP